MRIDCYLSGACPFVDRLRKNITDALALEDVEETVSFHRIKEAEAGRLSLNGSPSVFMNGRDILPGSATGFS